MATVERKTFGNHEVVNQPPPLVDYNLFESDKPLVEAVAREGAEWARERITAVGEYAGSGAAQELGRLANENGPKLKTHDRFGNRIDLPEFHPAWHELLGVAVANELHCSPWKDPRPGAHVARGAAFMCMSQADLDDLLGDPGAADAARAGCRVGASLPLLHLRLHQHARAGEGRLPRRDGDD
jgi:putative acyl-CoA dehydrogenase